MASCSFEETVDALRRPVWRMTRGAETDLRPVMELREVEVMGESASFGRIANGELVKVEYGHAVLRSRMGWMPAPLRATPDLSIVVVVEVSMVVVDHCSQVSRCDCESFN